MSQCLNCGTELIGTHCHNCGQKVVDRKDKTVAKFLIHFFNEFFNWDSKFFSSVKYLFFKPGYLSEQYNNGVVEKFISPLKLYLCVSLVVFLASSKIDTDFLTPLIEDDSIFKGFVEKKIEQKKVSFESFNEKFTSEIYDKLPLYTIFMMFFFSLPLNLLFIARKKLFVENLVFSLHFYSITLFSVLVGSLIDLTGLDLNVLFVFIFPLIYLLFAVKRTYKFSYPVTILFMVPLSCIFLFLWFVWFFAAFFITLYTV